MVLGESVGVAEDLFELHGLDFALVKKLPKDRDDKLLVPINGVELAGLELRDERVREVRLVEIGECVFAFVVLVERHGVHEVGHPLERRVDNVGLREVRR